MDLKLLASLREKFLSEKPSAGGDYWSTRGHLESYDASFARRIGWKWDAVLNEMRERGWHPAEDKPALVDWGCGTGIATRRTLDHFGVEHFSSAWIFDRSKLAEDFTAEHIKGIKVERLRDARPEGNFVLLLSHVLNELSEDEARDVLVLAASAKTIVWVEPGTPELSKKLISIREELQAGFRTIAPCPHQGRCGMLTPENERHWCHHFAKAPAEAFQSAQWREFATSLNIDLRSLPVSFIVLDRKAPEPAPGARVIGRPRRYKGFSSFLSCEAPNTVVERKATNGKNPELYRDLKEDQFTRFVDFRV